MRHYHVGLRLRAKNISEADIAIKNAQQFLAAQGIEVSVVEAVRNADKEPETIVYTDGGCDLKKNGIGAWAFVAQLPNGQEVERVGTALETTNNRMEMQALIEALKVLEIGSPLVIHADSQYVINGVTVWSRNWVRNGWRTASGGDVGNRDLWEELLQLYALHQVRFVHVRGHTGVPGNERVDELCTEAMTALHKQILLENAG